MNRAWLMSSAVFWALTSALPAGAEANGDANDTTQPGGESAPQNATPSKTPVVETVTVSSQRQVEPTNGGALGNRSVLDTPFSVNVVSSEDLLDRQVSSLGEVFANDPSVDSAGNSFTFHGNHINVRGLQLDEANGYRINGLPIYNFSVELPLEDFEQVELLKGATGFQYGFGSPGGIVNYVTKKPTDNQTLSVDLGYQEESVLNAHADIGGRFGSNDILGYRLNVSREYGDAYNGTRIDRSAAALSLDGRVTSSLTWTSDFIYQERDTKGQVQGFGTAFYTGTSLPPEISGDKHLPASEGSFFDTDFFLASTGLRWDISPDWQGRFDYSHSHRQARFAADWFYPTNAAWDYVDYINASRSSTDVDQEQVIVTGKLATGPFDHQVVVGASNEEQSNELNANQVWRELGTGNLYSGSRLSYTEAAAYAPYTGTVYSQKALFASDTVQLIIPGLSLLAGVRYTDYEQDSYDYDGAKTQGYKKFPITPTVALIYKPRPDTTLYASYVEALEQGSTVAITYANANQTLSPLRSKQYETGIKFDTGAIGASAALFQLDRGAEYANAQNYYVQDGTVRYQGLELEGHIKLLDPLTLTAGTTFLDARYQDGDPSVRGHRAEGAPRFQSTARLEYRVPEVPGLKLDAGARYLGDETIDSAGALRLPGYALFDAGASYSTTVSGQAVTYRLRGENLGDKSYWYYVQPGYFYNGASRTVLFNVQVGL